MSATWEKSKKISCRVAKWREELTSLNRYGPLFGLEKETRTTQRNGQGSMIASCAALTDQVISKCS